MRFSEYYQKTEEYLRRIPTAAYVGLCAAMIAVPMAVAVWYSTRPVPLQSTPQPKPKPASELRMHIDDLLKRDDLTPEQRKDVEQLHRMALEVEAFSGAVDEIEKRSRTLQKDVQDIQEMLKKNTPK